MLAWCGVGSGFQRSFACTRPQRLGKTYNLVRPLKTLRQEIKEQAARFERRWRHRSPAMAAGLTDELWTIEQVLRTVPLPATNNT